MSKDNQVLQMVFVTWHDIIQSAPNWQTREEGLDWADSEDGIVYQSGFILDDDENYLTLTDSYFKSCDTIGSVTRIPKSVIKSMKIIPNEIF
jgi:hypothetical protein